MGYASQGSGSVMTNATTLKRIPRMRLRETLASDVVAGQTVHDRVYGNVWTITGSDGRLLTAVDDVGHSVTMRISPSDYLYVLLPLDER